MAVANGRLDTDDLSPIPAGFHTHGTTAYLRADAAASFLRLAAAFEQRFGKRLVAMSFYRPLSDQVRIFLKNYFRVDRKRSRKTDRTYQGSTYQLRAGMAPVASPGYSNHGLAITVDFNSGVQTRGSKEHDWMLSTGTKYGWDWTEGRRIGEPWHWSYMSSKDRMKGAPKAPTPTNNAAAITVADLAETQRKLLALGYAPGPLDGSLGPSTRAAVKTYQTDRGLTADGSPGPTTRKALDQDMTTLKNVEAKLDRAIAIATENQKRINTIRSQTAPTELQRAIWGLGGGANAPMIGRRLEGGKEYPETTLGSLTDRIVRQQLVPLRGEVAGLVKAVEQLATGKGVDPEEIKKAVAAGVDEALGSLEVTVSKGD